MSGFNKSPLGNHIELLTGYPFKSELYTESETSIALLRGDNVIQGSIRWDDAKRWPNNLSDGLEKYFLREGDFVIAMDRTWVKSGLKAAIITNRDIPCILVQRVARLRPKKSLDPFFLSLLIRSHQFEQYVKGVQTETAVPHISPQQIKDFLVVLPSLPEQTAIASLLSTWDLAIEKTERLIAAKEKQKKSLMQSLLTGKQRINGFQKSWSEFHLGELFKERSERGNEVLPLISITRENGIIPRNEDRKDTSNEDKSKYLRICPGDIGYNTMRMWQGVSALSSLEGIVSPAYTICTPKKAVDGEFMAYLFKLPRIINLFYRHSQGLTSDTWNLKYHHFQEIKVTIPEIEEQKTIAKTLKACDEEIDLLKKQADAYRRQKRGLMQRLLTGEWQVRVG